MFDRSDRCASSRRGKKQKRTLGTKCIAVFDALFRHDDHTASRFVWEFYLQMQFNFVNLPYSRYEYSSQCSYLSGINYYEMCEKWEKIDFWLYRCKNLQKHGSDISKTAAYLAKCYAHFFEVSIGCADQCVKCQRILWWCLWKSLAIFNKLCTILAKTPQQHVMRMFVDGM